MQTGLLYYFLSSSNFSLFDLLEESRRKKVTKEANSLRQVVALCFAQGTLTGPLLPQQLIFSPPSLAYKFHICFSTGPFQ